MNASGFPKELRRERIAASPRWDGERFRNTHAAPRGTGPMPSLKDFLCGGNRRVPQAPLPALNPLDAWLRAPHSGLRATWLGHSTVLLEIDGWRVLTDPVWGPRASPSRFVGPKTIPARAGGGERTAAARCGAALARSLRSSRLHHHAHVAACERAHRHFAGRGHAPGVLRHRAGAHRRARLVGNASRARHGSHAHRHALTTFLRSRTQGRQQDPVVVLGARPRSGTACFSVAIPDSRPNTPRPMRASAPSTW